MGNNNLNILQTARSSAAIYDSQDCYISQKTIALLNTYKHDRFAKVTLRDRVNIALIGWFEPTTVAVMINWVPNPPNPTNKPQIDRLLVEQGRFCRFGSSLYL